MTLRSTMIALSLLSLCTACTTTTIRSSNTGWSVSGKQQPPATPKQRRAKSPAPRETPPLNESNKTPTSNRDEELAPTSDTAKVPAVLADAPGDLNSKIVIAPVEKVPVKTKLFKAHNEAHLIFDFPVTYNARVRKWIKYFQTSGRPSFRTWLQRSSRYIPQIQDEMRRANLPLDLAYVAMIESGFSSIAQSHASAMGMWQFIAPTGQRYGLAIDWWIDERRDFEKSTKAAIGYMTDLYEQFGSWYLVAASYNMGENGVRRLIKRHKTNSFWDLADRGALPEETRDYLPKMLAAMLIAKAPALYGFRGLEFQAPYAYESLDVPGGTDLINLANHLGVSERALTELNPELLKAFIPREVKTHRIRIPKGSKIAVSQYVSGQYVNNPVRTIQ